MSSNKTEEDGDFISKKVGYMAQAIHNNLADEGMKTFSSLTTDSERFGFIWKRPETHDILQLEPEFETKSLEKARSHRERGNEYFQRQSYVTALGEYNMSVKYAPQHQSDSHTSSSTNMNGEAKNNDKPNEDGVVQPILQGPGDIIDGEAEPKIQEKEAPKNELALAYANRSATLFHLKRYTECLRDIELAFDNKYPEEMHHKLYERQGASLREMGRINEAVASFQKSIESISVAGLSQKAASARLLVLGKLMDACRKMETKSKTFADEDIKSNLPGVTGEKNSSYPHASYAVKIQYNNVVGRHTVAARDVKVGDVLMSESPYAAVVLPGGYATSHCNNCFALVRAPVSCTQCSAVVFCSGECQRHAWQTYHWAECSYGELLTPSTCASIGHLAMRLVMTMGLDALLAYLKSDQQVEPLGVEKAGVNSEGVYSADSIDAVYNLVANSKSRKPEDLLEFTTAACVLMKILEVSGYLQPIKGSLPDVELVGGAMLRFLLIIQCNAKRIVELSWPEKFDDPKAVNVGVGLYPTVALVNHSCDPNADLNFFGNSVIVRAIRNIAEGEEICVSYGPIFYEVKQRSRSSQLKGAFFFSCRCAACQESWPICEEMFSELPRYRCEKCRSPLVVEDKFERKFITCAICKNKQDMEELVGKLQLSFDVFARAMNAAMTGRADAALPDFVQHLLLLQTYIRHPWRDLASCQSAVKQCYRLSANTRQK